jgi:hypothetical protein
VLKVFLTEGTKVDFGYLEMGYVYTCYGGVMRFGIGEFVSCVQRDFNEVGV